MQLEVKGHSCYCYTGGRPFDAARPTAVFLHGVLNDHSVWGLQTRYLAHHGWSVLAPDLPGHGRSAGPAPATVEDAADFALALLDALKLERAALVGHSFGSLAALEAASRAPGRIDRLALLATAYPMKVSPALLEAAEHEPLRAIEMTTTFSLSTLAPPPSALGPGTWLHGHSRALMRRILQSNARENVAHTGFRACDRYRGGEEAMARVQAPTLFLIGARDAMTPPGASQALRARARDARVVTVDAGHAMMAEAPDAVLAALTSFLAP
ncbi:alpha/beta fold hydrolase [Ramlibacter rhizophilus]|uniref:Alpha/beta hydrolase n=1 Tax=Ramlibacter rhizophilus TaxID=1781167 RepID=A0A4Z0BDP0_9BURK|nr:alpha/beta hydrolase [Ramlibacter rhizophilus]TFY96437.1 alpha/beta hydrolase [Ramlibacter rhizophilus]